VLKRDPPIPPIHYVLPAMSYAACGDQYGPAMTRRAQFVTCPDCLGIAEVIRDDQIIRRRRQAAQSRVERELVVALLDRLSTPESE
jgi:hypothetical protein